MSSTVARAFAATAAGSLRAVRDCGFGMSFQNVMIKSDLIGVALATDEAFVLAGYFVFLKRVWVSLIEVLLPTDLVPEPSNEGAVGAQVDDSDLPLLSLPRMTVPVVTDQVVD